MALDAEKVLNMVNSALASGEAVDERAVEALSVNSKHSSLKDLKDSFKELFKYRKILSPLIDAFDRLGGVIKSFTFDPILEGLDEYNTKIIATRTISNQLVGQMSTMTGKIMDSTEAIKETTVALDNLNEYADKTVYKFSDMTTAATRFVNDGFNLDDAVGIAKGLANLVAYVGGDQQAYSTAVEMFSQGMETGYMQKYQMRYLRQQTLVTEDFQRLFLETSKLMGGDAPDELAKVYESAEKGESFQDTVSDWMSSAVMYKALGGVLGVAIDAVGKGEDQAKAEYREYLEGIFEVDDIDDDVFEFFYNMNIAASNASTQIKTASQLIDVAKESIATGWSQVFDSMFGGLKTATELWTGLSDLLSGENGFITRTMDSIAKGMETDFVNKGGPEKIRQIFMNLIILVERLYNGFTKVLMAVTGAKSAGDALFKLISMIERLTDVIVNFTGSKVVQGFASILGVIGSVLSGTVGSIVDLVQKLMNNIGNGSLIDLIGTAIGISDQNGNVSMASILLAAVKIYAAGKIISIAMRSFQSISILDVLSAVGVVLAMKVLIDAIDSMSSSSGDIFDFAKNLAKIASVMFMVSILTFAIQNSVKYLLIASIGIYAMSKAMVEFADSLDAFEKVAAFIDGAIIKTTPKKIAALFLALLIFSKLLKPLTSGALKSIGLAVLLVGFSASLYLFSVAIRGLAESINTFNPQMIEEATKRVVEVFKKILILVLAFSIISNIGSAVKKFISSAAMMMSLVGVSIFLVAIAGSFALLALAAKNIAEASPYIDKLKTSLQGVFDTLLTTFVKLFAVSLIFGSAVKKASMAFISITASILLIGVGIGALSIAFFIVAKAIKDMDSTKIAAASYIIDQIIDSLGRLILCFGGVAVLASAFHASSLRLLALGAAVAGLAAAIGIVMVGTALIMESAKGFSIGGFIVFINGLVYFFQSVSNGIMGLTLALTAMAVIGVVYNGPFHSLYKDISLMLTSIAILVVGIALAIAAIAIVLREIGTKEVLWAFGIIVGLITVITVSLMALMASATQMDETTGQWSIDTIRSMGTSKKSPIGGILSSLGSALQKIFIGITAVAVACAIIIREDPEHAVDNMKAVANLLLLAFVGVTILLAAVAFMSSIMKPETVAKAKDMSKAFQAMVSKFTLSIGIIFASIAVMTAAFAGIKEYDNALDTVLIVVGIVSILMAALTLTVIMFASMGESVDTGAVSAMRSCGKLILAISASMSLVLLSVAALASALSMASISGMIATAVILVEIAVILGIFLSSVNKMAKSLSNGTGNTKETSRYMYGLATVIGVVAASISAVLWSMSCLASNVGNNYGWAILTTAAVSAILAAFLTMIWGISKNLSNSKSFLKSIVSLGAVTAVLGVLTACVVAIMSSVKNMASIVGNSWDPFWMFAAVSGVVMTMTFIIFGLAKWVAKSGEYLKVIASLGALSVAVVAVAASVAIIVGAISKAILDSDSVSKIIHTAGCISLIVVAFVALLVLLSKWLSSGDDYLKTIASLGALIVAVVAITGCIALIIDVLEKATQNMNFGAFVESMTVLVSVASTLLLLVIVFAVVAIVIGAIDAIFAKGAISRVLLVIAGVVLAIAAILAAVALLIDIIMNTLADTTKVQSAVESIKYFLNELGWTMLGLGLFAGPAIAVGLISLGAGFLVAGAGLYVFAKAAEVCNGALPQMSELISMLIDKAGEAVEKTGWKVLAWMAGLSVVLALFSVALTAMIPPVLTFTAAISSMVYALTQLIDALSFFRYGKARTGVSLFGSSGGFNMSTMSMQGFDLSSMMGEAGLDVNALTKDLGLDMSKISGGGDSSSSISATTEKIANSLLGIADNVSLIAKHMPASTSNGLSIQAYDSALGKGV